jgi:phosphatidylglycerol:prolipoprotein diacylglycerol transferase
VYPILFHVFGFPISSFGVMLAIAFLVGTWLTTRRMSEEGLDPELGSSMLIYVLLGGIGGSKLYFAVDTSLREGLTFSSLWPALLLVLGTIVLVDRVLITVSRRLEEGPSAELRSRIRIDLVLSTVFAAALYFGFQPIASRADSFFSLLAAREGITWYGGLIGAVIVGAIGCRRNGIPIVLFANCGAAATAVGQALGRIGCFLVGDDYGRVSDVPWAIAFPQGAPPTLDPVHPTQLYEAAWLSLVAVYLWRRRRASPFLFGEYLALNGAGRFVIEMWRVNPRVAAGLTEPQWIGISLIALGVGGWLYFRAQRPDGRASAGSARSET